VSFAGDTGFRDWLPTQKSLDDWVTAEASLLAHFQLNVINLEFGLPGFTGREMDGRIDRTMSMALRQVGCGLVSVGNNHVLDYGPEGVSHTVAELRKSGIQVIGLRSHPVYLWQPNGRRIAIFSLTAGTDKDDPQRLTLDLDNVNLAWIQELAERASFRIAFVHLGSMSSFPSEHERSEAARLLARGADLVVFTGSHFIKGFVLENGKPVVYGLGNHLFSYVDAQTETLGMFLTAGFGPSGLEQLFVVPFRNNIRDGKTGPLAEPDFRAFERLLRERSTTDTSRYYSDPRSLGVLKNSLRRLHLSNLRQLEPRHFLLAARIVWRNYAFAVVSVGSFVVALVTIVVAQRRRLRPRPTVQSLGAQMPAASSDSEEK
jgi:hypothetical protein